MLNNIQIMGRLTKDPELRHMPDGSPMCHFLLAVDRDHRTRDGVKETDFIDVVAWRSVAEFAAKHLERGRMAVVLGRLQLRIWTDAQGVTHKSPEVVARSVYFTDSAARAGGEAPAVGEEAFPDAGRGERTYAAGGGNGFRNAAGSGSWPCMADKDGPFPGESGGSCLSDGGCFPPADGEDPLGARGDDACLPFAGRGGVVRG